MSAQDKSGKDKPRYILPIPKTEKLVNNGDSIAKVVTSATKEVDEAHAMDSESSTRSESEANLLLQLNDIWRAERANFERQQMQFQDAQMQREVKAKQAVGDIHTKQLAIFKQIEGKQFPNHDVDTTLNLSSWFGPADMDTSLQLCSWGGLGLAQLPAGCRRKDDAESDRKFASTSSSHANAVNVVPSTDNVNLRKRPRPAHFISLGAAYAWDLEAAIRRQNMRRNLKPPVTGHANFCHRAPAVGPAVPAPRTPEAEDVVHNDADGRLVRHRVEEVRWLEENRNPDIDHQLPHHASRLQLHIRPLIPAKRVWTHRVHKDVRTQLGEGYRLTIAHVRQQHVFQPVVPVPVMPRPDGDEKSDMTTEALIHSSTAPSAEGEETESEFRP